MIKYLHYLKYFGQLTNFEMFYAVSEVVKKLSVELMPDISTFES